MSKLLAIAVCGVLLSTATGAFVSTEAAKTELAPIYETKIAPVFSPTCDPRFCATRSAAIDLKLRKREYLRAWIEHDGKDVATLIAGRSYPKGPVRLAFTGRTSADGAVLPDGVYVAVVNLTREHRTIILPSPIRLDTRAPEVVPPRHLLRGHLSPEGDHDHDTIRIPYDLTAPAHLVVLVDGREAMFTRSQKRAGFVVWNGTVGGVLRPPGRHLLQLAAQDAAGNRSRPVRAAKVWIAVGHTKTRARLITLDANGGFAVGRRPTFLVALSNPPPLAARTQSGVRAPVEIVRTGVDLVRVGPVWGGWTRRELQQVLAWERAAARLGVFTWVRLNAFASTHPRWRGDAHLAAIVHALTRSRFVAGMGLWQGADEPWSRHVAARALAFVYCRLTSHGEPSACAGEPPLDRHHLLGTILAPTGRRVDLAPYSAVTDVLGVDVYPVTFTDRKSPDLHEVGIWTRAIATISPRRSVWTTLQICSSHSYDERTGAYVLPSTYQERYMLYDAIINGARGVAFFGGDNPHCWNRLDRRYGWNWSFWNRTLDGLIEQIGYRSALGRALGTTASDVALRTNASGVEATSRVVRTHSGTQLWIIAARNNSGVGPVSLSGLPPSVKSAVVYGENRTIRVSNGTVDDTFRRWQVHIYRMQLTRSSDTD